MLRIIGGHRRSFAAVLVGATAWLLLPLLRDGLHVTTHALLAWDVGCVAFLGSVAWMFRPSRDTTIEQDAVKQEEGEWTVFAITIAASIASFAAIIGEFSASKEMTAGTKTLHIGLVGLTLFSSWLLTHAVFSLRYAHEYYEPTPKGGVVGGLEFPGGQSPDYWDFFYFAIVLGMTFQVSDVTIRSREMRRIATAHGLLSFLFNTILLALSVNIGAGLL